MDFLCLKNWIATGIVVLAWFASPWLAMTQAVVQKAKEKPAIELPSRSDEVRPAPQPPQKKADQRQEQPSVKTPAAPTTDDEIRLVQRLLNEVDAPVYKTRQSAARQLIKLGNRLPLILADIGQPTSIEARAAVAKAYQRLEEKSFVQYRWRLTTWAMKGEKLDLGPSSITLNEDKSFIQSGNTSAEPDTWSFNKATQELTMDFNSGYAIYIGKEDEDGNFVGMATNKKQKQWHFELERIGKRN